MDIRSRLIAGLDIVKPDWFIVYATQQELAECSRACTDKHSGTVQAYDKLRREICERLFDVLRAGLGSWRKPKGHTSQRYVLMRANPKDHPKPLPFGMIGDCIGERAEGDQANERITHR